VQCGLLLIYSLYHGYSTEYIILCQAHGNTGMLQSSSMAFQSAPSVIQPSNAVPRFPAVVDPLTQAAVAQVGAVYQAAAAAAYKAVAASGLMPNLPHNVPSLTAQASHPQPGLYTAVVLRPGRGPDFPDFFIICHEMS